MGYPTDNAAQIDAANRALADKILDFTNEIGVLAAQNVPQINVGVGFDPVVSIGGERPQRTDEPVYSATVANNAAYSGFGTPAIATTGIAQLSVPAPPTAPLLDFGTAPVSNLPSVPGSPALQTTTVPIKPDLSIPAVPGLANINIPVLNTPILPTYDQVFPAIPDTLAVDPNNFVYSEEDYISTELTNLQNLLNDDLTNGGFGVNHVDEEELFERQRARMRRELIIDEEELFDSFSARGFMCPQGDQIDQVRVLQKQTTDKMQEVELDISTERADLIRKSRENVIAQTNQLNQSMTTYRGFMQQRLMQAAEFLASHSVNLFNAKVSRHNLVIQAYNSFTGSYQAQVDAAVSQIQIAKIEIEAEALKSEINTNTIKLYQAQVDSVTSIIQMYQVEVEAAKTISDIERDKLEIFKTEIDSYKAQVEAEVSKANLYATQLGAEEVKSRVFATNVTAYEAEVRANISEQGSRIEEANIRVREDGLRLERYRSEIDLYRANIDRTASEIQVNASILGSRASSYGSYASQYASWVSTLIQEENVEVQGSISAQDLQSRNAQFNVESQNQRARLQAESAASAARVFGEYASANATINTNVDIDVS